MQTRWLQWLYLAVTATLLLSGSSANMLERPGETGGRHLSAARMGTVRRNHRIKSRREAARRRASEEEGTTRAIEAGEDAPKDSSHSAVKAMKARIAKSRKMPAALIEMEDDAGKDAEGSERQLQAREAASEKAMLTQRGASGKVEEKAEEGMTPAEEFELEMTGVLDDVEEQELPSAELHRESEAAASLHSQGVLSKMAPLDDVDGDDDVDLPSEVHGQQEAAAERHRQAAVSHEVDDDEPELEPEYGYGAANVHPKGVKASPKLAVGKALPRRAVPSGQEAAGNSKGQEPVRAIPQLKQNSEGAKLPAVTKLPPWFKEGFRDTSEKPKPRMGSGRAHASRALSHEEKWLRAHQRHLSLAADRWDVVLFGDDLVEAWRGTFLGQAYGPFSKIPAVWETTFGAQSYSALAAGIAGDGVEQLNWRLENGELPHVPPKVIVLAVGTNSKGMAGECRVDLAEKTAAEMSELLSGLTEAIPETQLVLMAPLPKGEYWPNRCTPAFRIFKQALQDFTAEHPEHVHFLDMSTSFLVRPASEIWANATAVTRQEVNEMFMPDAQHPSAAGMRIIAAELEPLVRRLVSAAPVDMDSS